MAGSIQGPARSIVLMGRSGSGKSATGNTILGSKVFDFDRTPSLRTKSCQKEEAQLKDRKVVVVDTPGFFHASRADKDIAAEVSEFVNFCSPGPHVILHVMHPYCTSQDEMYVAWQIKEIFGSLDYTIILFTHKHGLKGSSKEKFISSRDEKLKEYIAECRNRCLLFNNKAEGGEREAQMAELLTMIDNLVHGYSYAPCCTEDMMNVN